MGTVPEAPASITAEGTTPHTQNQAHPTVYELMARVMGDVRNVSKNGQNKAQNYSFRGYLG
ncbi:ERF family protein [Streptomyces sp. 8L]|uniref:ERF family protein n=1 Tax=Streptomyces sp. 8L TaxID=2877242 RepID=UPI001CD7B007|nr:ERF family protein [Streptomyces sp. 8L]MCA1224315.1 ERF family protein [Streptomyces sp. 8L]